MAFSLVKEYHQHAHTAGSYDFAALQELEASWVPSPSGFRASGERVEASAVLDIRKEIVYYGIAISNC